MLPRKYRLSRHRDIVDTIRRGTRLATPYVFVHYHSTKEPHTRVACIVGKQVSTSAVKRHQYQRWLRTSAGSIIGAQSFPRDIVFIARPQITQLKSAKKLQENLLLYFDKL